jgi:hypothetical protein
MTKVLAAVAEAGITQRFLVMTGIVCVVDGWLYRNDPKRFP